MRGAALVLAMLAACSPIEPPVVEGSPLPDTSDTRGPYPVAARVRTRRDLRIVELVWHNAAVSAGQAVRVRMERDDAGAWRAGIPGQGPGAVVAYHVEAEDSEGDRGYDPPDSERVARCGAEYCFTVR